MSCQQDHTKLTTNYCPECGTAKPVVLSVEDNIAKQLNEIIKEIVAETGERAFFRTFPNCSKINIKQNQLFISKIIKRKLEIPDGMQFVITTDGGRMNRIFTMTEVKKLYPFLNDCEIPFISYVNDSKTYHMNFRIMYGFLVANGDFDESTGKFFNNDFDEFLQTGFPATALSDGSYDTYHRIKNDLDCHTAENKKRILDKLSG